MGSRSDQRAHVPINGLTFELTSSRSNEWAHVRMNGLTFEATGSCSKRRVHVRSDRLTLEATGSCSNQWPHIQSKRRDHGRWSVWVGCVDAMLVLMQCCCQEVAMKGNSEGIERRATYGSPLHAPGGSPTPCVSSHIFLCHPKPPLPTRTFIDAKK